MGAHGAVRSGKSPPKNGEKKVFLGTDTNVGCEGDAWHSRGGKKNTMENKEEWRKKEKNGIGVGKGKWEEMGREKGGKK